MPELDPDVAMPNTLNHIFSYLLIRVFFQMLASTIIHFYYF